MASIIFLKVYENIMNDLILFLVQDYGLEVYSVKGWFNLALKSNNDNFFEIIKSIEDKFEIIDYKHYDLKPLTV